MLTVLLEVHGKLKIRHISQKNGENQMTHENNPIIGYGIFDTFDPLYLGKGGYGFLIRQEDHESVEELREWFTRVVQEYPLVNKDLEFVTFYNEGAPERTIKYELETSLYYRNTRLTSFDHFRYHTATWNTVRRDLELDKVMEEEYRRTDGAVDNYDPLY